MGWTKISSREPVHRCDVPRAGAMQVGDVIRCDCGQHWVLTRWPGDFRNEAEYSWKQCNERGYET